MANAATSDLRRLVCRAGSGASLLVMLAPVLAACGASSGTASTSPPTAQAPAAQTSTTASTSSASPPTRLRVRATRSVPIDGAPLQVGLGSVWSASSQGLVRLSVPTGKPSVVVRSPTDDIALSGGFVYALSRSTNTVIRFDPRQMNVTRRWRLPAGAHSLTAGDHAIYLALSGPPTAVERIDLLGGATHRAAIPSSGVAAQDEAIAAGPDAVWLTDGNSLYQLNPTTLSVVRATSLGFQASDIWFGDGSLWAASENPDGGVERINPTSGRVLARSQSDAIQIAFSPHAVWLAAAAGPTAIDPVTAKTEAALPTAKVLSQGAGGIAVVANEVWTVYTDIGTLQRVFPDG